MPQAKEIKNRIESVKKTRKITQAMKMVAAAKFKRASEKSVAFKIYYEKYQQILKSLSKNEDVLHQSVFFKSNDCKKEAIILVGADKGLCGGYNSNVTKEASRFLAQKRVEVDLYLFGKKLSTWAKKSNEEVKLAEPVYQENLSVKTLKAHLGQLVDDFTHGKIGKVHLVYTQFKSALSSQVVVDQVLPFKWDEKDIKSKEEDVNYDYIIEPSAEDIVKKIIKETWYLTIYRSILEGQAAEQGARMAAMDSATDNAAEMINDLSLIYNRTRQAQITTELSEIVAGANALN